MYAGPESTRLVQLPLEVLHLLHDFGARPHGSVPERNGGGWTNWGRRCEIAGSLATHVQNDMRARTVA